VVNARRQRLQQGVQPEHPRGSRLLAGEVGPEGAVLAGGVVGDDEDVVAGAPDVDLQPVDPHPHG